MYIPSYKNIIEKFESPYKFCILVSQRTKQLNQGADPYIESEGNNVTVAMQEVIEGYVSEESSNE